MIDSFVRNRFDKLIDSSDTNPYAMAENEWVTINQNIIEFLKSVNDENYIQLSYEQLVGNPKETMNAIFQKMNLDFEETVLNPYEHGSMFVGPGDFNIMMHDKIDSNLANKWKTIRLPFSLKEKTIQVARYFNYKL
jgi:hypothetical protein